MKSMRVNIMYCSEDLEESRIGSFECENYSEMLKMLEICKENEVTIYLREDAEGFDSELIKNNTLGGMVFIDDYNLNIGDDDCIQGIDVWVK